MIAKRSAALALALTIACLVPVTAFAHVRSRVVVRVGHAYRPPARVYYTPRVRTVRVTRVNYGTVDFNVRPQRSKIFVDGAYLGIADQFNGYPQTASLPAGYHEIRIESPTGEEFRQRIFVAAGKEFNFNLQF